MKRRLQRQVATARRESALAAELEMREKAKSLVATCDNYLVDELAAAIGNIALSPASRAELDRLLNQARLREARTWQPKMRYADDILEMAQRISELEAALASGREE